MQCVIYLGGGITSSRSVMGGRWGHTPVSYTSIDDYDDEINLNNSRIQCHLLVFVFANQGSVANMQNTINLPLCA
jgi:hypothetical protein